MASNRAAFLRAPTIAQLTASQPHPAYSVKQDQPGKRHAHLDCFRNEFRGSDIKAVAFTLEPDGFNVGLLVCGMTFSVEDKT